MEKAQHLKQFINEVKEIITNAAGHDIVRYIPQGEMEYLYKIRFRPVRVMAAPGESIPADVLRFANYMVTILFKDMRITVGVGALRHLSLYSFFSTCYTVMIYGQGLKDNAYPHAAEVKNALAPLADLIDSSVLDDAIDRFYEVMFLAAVFCCDISGWLYSIHFNPDIMKRGILKLGMFSEVYKTQLPKVKVFIDGHQRPAWHLGWCFSEYEPPLILVSVKSDDICQPPGNMLNVYIQSHALHRLSERLDGLDLGILHFSIYNSLSSPKVINHNKGMLLFEYTIFKNKAGYFVGEVVDGKVILKTFLFLTNVGTPEAQKLQAATGLMKEDIIYLAIDKLSTFLHSDIASNDRIKQLFIDAGCESLFKIDKGFFVSNQGGAKTSKAELIAQYLQLNADENDFGFLKNKRLWDRNLK